jgi:hypothetical protein
MRVAITLLVGLLGFWLGWYYGAILGYAIWPNSEWIGALFAYLVAPFCAFVAIWITWKLRSRRHKQSL